MAETGIKKEIADLRIQVDDVQETSSKICDKYDLTVEMNFYDRKERGLKKEQKIAVEKKLSQLRKPQLAEVALAMLASLYECSQALWTTSALLNFSEDSELEAATSRKPAKPEKLMSDFDSHLKDVNEKLMKWGDDITSQMNDIIKQRVDETLPEITKEVVDETIKSKKFNRPWADLFKKTQSEFKAEANNVFKETLSTALTDSQHGILEKLQMKHDSDMYQKEKRSRNIVISNCPESSSENAQERMNYDRKFVKRVTGLSDASVLKCIRAGPRIDRDTRRKAIARPIIVTVGTPDLAKELHKYGNGNKVLSEGEIWWINPDLTISERQANYRARQLLKSRKSRDRLIPDE